MQTTKIPYQELCASDLTAYALEMLRLAKCRVRRVNNIPHNKRYKGQVEPGWPDVQGYTPHGRIVLCEIKKKGDKLSDKQRERLTDCHECGGLAMVCYQKENSAVLVNFIEYEMTVSNPKLLTK